MLGLHSCCCVKQCAAVCITQQLAASCSLDCDLVPQPLPHFVTVPPPHSLLSTSAPHPSPTPLCPWSLSSCVPAFCLLSLLEQWSSYWQTGDDYLSFRAFTVPYAVQYAIDNNLRDGDSTDW